MADRVLITGARAAAALDIARDFAFAGWQVHMADCSAAHIARASRIPAGVHHYPSPVADPAGFRRGVAGLVSALDPVLVVPTCEEVFHLAAPMLADVLRGRLLAPALATLRCLHDKLAFAQACAAWGLPVPESHAVGDAADMARFRADSHQWVFKRRFSRFGDATLVGPDHEDLATIRFDADRPWLAQKRVFGVESCFHAVARDGELQAFAAYRSDWRLPGGACFAFTPETAGRAALLRPLAAQLARAAAIQGQFACDVMVDADGRPWLLECNPRATSGVHLLTGDGALARALTGQAPVPDRSGRAACLMPAMVVFGLPMALRRGQLSAWLRAVATMRDVISAPGDHLPVIGAMRDIADFRRHARRLGLSLAAATTHDIEWNGKELA